MPEKRSFAELAAAGWSEADLEWENAIEAAVAALAEGNSANAGEGLSACVKIAGRFAGFDPRLGTACANRAAFLATTGREEAAGLLARDARRAWAGCDGWVAAMTAPRVARSSLFHLRMEQRHRATYEARWRVKWSAMVAEARERLVGDEPLVLVSEREAAEALARWRREKPAMLNDTRKLMAAAMLLVTGRNTAS